MFDISFNTIESVLNFYMIFVVYSLTFSILFMLFGSKLYKKANKRTSDAIIPIYNLFVLIQITEIPIFYFLLFLFPVINILLIIYIEYKLYKIFGASLPFLFGLIFLPFIFIPMLSFGKYKYKNRLDKEKEEAEDKILIESSPILMSEEEINKLNNEEIKVNDIDSIFKSDAIVEEDITPYKASSASKNEIKEIYGNGNNISEEDIIEKETIKEIDNEKKEKDNVEIIDL